MAPLQEPGARIHDNRINLNQAAYGLLGRLDRVSVAYHPETHAVLIMGRGPEAGVRVLCTRSEQFIGPGTWGACCAHTASARSDPRPIGPGWTERPWS